MTSPLHLHEEVLLLALRDEKGTLASGAHTTFAMGGALLAELLLEGRVAVETEKKKKFLRVVDERPLGDPLLDEALAKVVDAKRRAQLKDWVSRFAHLKKMHHRAAAELCRKGILRADEDKVLFLFTRKIYPERDPRAEREVLKRLERAVFSESSDVEPRTVVLLALADSAGLLKANFDKHRLKGRKARIERVVNGDVSGKATQEAIQAMQAAVMAAVIIPAVITTTVTTST